jgi:allantoinase
VPGNEPYRRDLHRAGVRGFKCFLADSGVPEFPPLDRAGLHRAAAQIAGFGSLLLVHAEDPAYLGEVRGPGGCGEVRGPAYLGEVRGPGGCGEVRGPGGADYAAFLRSRPPQAETSAIEAVIEAARHTGVRAHIVHVSSADAIELLAAARAEGLAVTSETCPHYLVLAAEEAPAGATEFKCCPPIRERANSGRLWPGLLAGVIDCVVSDHSPCPPELKLPGTGDFAQAWGGIASLQLSLPLTWTYGRERGLGLADLTRWMAARPAQLAGLAGKGRIAVGCDADLVAFAPDASFVVEPGRLEHRHKLTPYAGRRLTGVVRRTWLRGREIFGTDQAATATPAGELL